jgi:hypothetical protein
MIFVTVVIFGLFIIFLGGELSIGLTKITIKTGDGLFKIIDKILKKSKKHRRKYAYRKRIINRRNIRRNP